MSKAIRTFRQRNFVRSLHVFLEELGSPMALNARDMLSDEQRHGELVSLDCHPERYSDRDSFCLDYVVANLFKKARFLKTGIDTLQVARDNLAACEAHNAVTNRRFRNLRSDPLYRGQTASVLETARWKISQVLGDFDIDELMREGRWGPGSSTTISYSSATPEEKFRAARGATPHAVELFMPVFQQAYPNWCSSVKYWEYQSGNEVTFVEKSAKTMRSIAKEPDFNLWFQLATGRMIRRRLRKVGIDLNTQANNQTAARIGSITGQIATLDVKDASNTLAFGLVEYLISDTSWFRVLDSLRSHYGTDGDSQRRWEMFSSMGNGFTFELETLIFWALSAASCEVFGCDPCVWVFGDDIAVPTDVVPVLSSILGFCGFDLNASKSFSKGSFRESCGVHYWDGIDCQPIYFKDNVTTAHEAYRRANSVRKLSIRLRMDSVCRASAALHRQLVLGTIPELRVGVPSEAGDVGFWVNPADDLVTGGTIEASVDLSPYHEFGWEGFYVRGLHEKTKKTEVSHVGVLLARLHGLSRTGCVLIDASRDSRGTGHGNDQVLREPGIPVFRNTFARRWTSPPPWETRCL